MKKTILCAGAVLLASGVFARPFSADQVPADAKWVVHADIARLRDSRMGREVIQQMDETGRRKLEAFSALFNFDLIEDIDSILLFGNSLEQGGKGVLLLNGQFDGEHLRTLLKANETYETKEHNGSTIHSWIDQKRGKTARTYGAMSSGGAIVVGDDFQLVAQALDVLEGRSAGLTGQTALDLSGRADAAFFAAALEVPDGATLPANAQMLRQARSLFLSLTEAGDRLEAQLEVVADSPEAAVQMESVVRGLVAMASLQSEARPELARLVESLQITKTSLGVSVRAEYPVEKVLQGIRDAAGKKGTKTDSNDTTAEQS